MMHVDSVWNVSKEKPRRPIETLILEDGMIDNLLADARDFFNSKSWYSAAGIPHRRGYLLYGPPGTGKSE